MKNGEGVTVIVYDAPQDQSLADFAARLAAFRADTVLYDTGGTGHLELLELRRIGIAAEPLPKGDRTNDFRRLNLRFLLQRAEQLLRDRCQERTRAESDLLFDIEAMKERC